MLQAIIKPHLLIENVIEPKLGSIKIFEGSVRNKERDEELFIIEEVNVKETSQSKKEMSGPNFLFEGTHRIFEALDEDEYAQISIRSWFVDDKGCDHHNTLMYYYDPTLQDWSLAYDLLD